MNSYAAGNVSNKAANTKPRWIMAVAFILLILLVLLFVADRLFDPQKFQIREIEVHGHLKHVDSAQVQQVAESALEGNYFSINLRQLENQIKQVPWVFSASLRRQWPSTIVVDVVEIQPVARWGEDKWLNFTGHLVERQQGSEWESNLNLPLLHGPVAQKQIVWEAFQKWSDRFSTNGLSLEQLILDSRDIWRLKFALGALAINKGQSTQGAEEIIDSPTKVTMVVDKANSFSRIERFIEALNQELIGQLPQMKNIDLRYPNGFAISWQEFSSVAQTITKVGLN